MDSHSGGEKRCCKDSAATLSNKYRIAILCVILTALVRLFCVLMFLGNGYLVQKSAAAFALLKI